MPKNAKVFIAEDLKMAYDAYRKELEKEGHTIVHISEDLRDALETISRFQELGVQVAILDGKLRGGDGIRDGLAMLEKIKHDFPQVKTIGMSSANIPGVTKDLGKENASKLGSIVTSL